MTTSLDRKLERVARQLEAEAAERARLAGPRDGLTKPEEAAATPTATPAPTNQAMGRSKLVGTDLMLRCYYCGSWFRIFGGATQNDLDYARNLEKTTIAPWKCGCTP